MSVFMGSPSDYVDTNSGASRLLDYGDQSVTYLAQLFLRAVTGAIDDNARVGRE
jgi:hypothetical protein